MSIDLHSSLKTEVLKKIGSSFGEIVLVKQAWSKTEIRYSVHVSPNTYSASGLQWPDFLSYLGFQRQSCTIFTRQQCFAKQVDSADFDLDLFASKSVTAFKNLENAQTSLGGCGFSFHQPEGWSYYFGKPSTDRSTYNISSYSGDGHTSGVATEVMKQSEDESFKFLFSWIKLNEQSKGWTIHYKPKHLPLSTDMQSVFNFLGLKSFESCPHFDFDPCWWKHIKYENDGAARGFGMADRAHAVFEAQATSFSKGIKNLLQAQADMESVGMGFLKIEKPEIRRKKDINFKLQPKQIATTSKVEAPVTDKNFDVAISFAGTERTYAESLANYLTSKGLSVFYDDFYPEQLWGKDLVEFFHDIYSKRARYCVMFVSKQYLDREWTTHERKSAQERMLKEKGNEYILPIKVDDIELPGLPSTIGYLSINSGIEKIANTLVAKLRTNS